MLWYIWALSTLLVLQKPTAPLSPEGHSRGHCHESLESADFKQYDLVADGKLYLSEFSKPRLRCFVWQLIHTTDKEVRDLFTNAIQNNLWEAVRKRLSIIDRGRSLSAPVEGVLHSLRKNEFSSRVVKKRVSAYYHFKSTQNKNSSGGVPYADTRITHYSYGSGALDFNVPFDIYRLKATLFMAGATSYGALSTTANTPGVGAREVRDTMGGLWLYGSSAVIKRNSRFKATISGGRDFYWGGLPDELSSWYYLSGTAALRRPWGSGVALESAASMVTSDYFAPLDTSHLTRFSRNIASVTTGSYLKKPFGLVIVHGFSDYDETTLFYREIQVKNSPSLLGQLSFARGYLRFGGGGGVWESAFRQAGETLYTRSEGREVHVTIEGQWRPAGWLRLKASAAGFERFSDDPGMGWYPTWETEGSVMLSLGKWYGEVSTKYVGHRIRLAYRQDRENIIGSMTLKYRKSRSVTLSISAQGDLNEQLQHQAFQEATWLVKPRFDLLLFDRPNIWLTVIGQYKKYTYEQTGLTQKSDEWYLSAYCNVRF